MSARLAIAARLAVGAALLVSSGCETLATSPSPAPTVYRSESGGHSITIASDSIIVDGVRYPLQDCSDATSACLSSPVAFIRAFRVNARTGRHGFPIRGQ
jgi:hypothetical protein